MDLGLFFAIGILHVRCMHITTLHVRIVKVKNMNVDLRRDKGLY